MQKVTALRGTQPVLMAALCHRGEEVGHGCLSGKIANYLHDQGMTANIKGMKTF